MSEKRLGFDERWSIEKASDGHGVFIGSTAHLGRYLSITNFADGFGVDNNGNSIKNSSFFGIDVNDQQDKSVLHTTTKPGEFAK